MPAKTSLFAVEGRMTYTTQGRGANNQNRGAMARRLSRLPGLLVGLTLVVGVLSAGAAERKIEGRVSDVRSEEGRGLPPGRSLAIAQAKQEGKRLYLAMEEALFVSNDGARSWDPLSLPSNEARILALAVDPHQEMHLYAGGRGGLWHSWDGGVTWESLPTPKKASSAIRAIAIAPTAPETIYLSTDREGVFRSANGGVSWRPASKGLPKALSGVGVATIRSLAIHPTDPHVAYTATELDGLYRTTDGGGSWAPINRGLGSFPLQWRAGSPSLLIDSIEPRQVMAMLIRPLHSHAIKTAVSQSSDGGAHWVAREVELLPGEQGVALTEDPDDPKGVLLFTTKRTLQIPWRSIEGIAPAEEKR
jgi:hypothetical protein